MSIQKTFVMIKPDGVRKRHIGEIITRFEQKGLTLRALKMIRMGRNLAERHYGIHRDRPFFGELIDFITSGPVVASVWEGEGAVSVVRTMVGATNPAEAVPGSIRGDFGLFTAHNIIHASDAAETAESEIKLFFSDSEMVG